MTKENEKHNLDKADGLYPRRHGKRAHQGGSLLLSAQQRSYDGKTIVNNGGQGGHE